MSTRDNLEREAHAASEKLQEAGATLRAKATDAAEQAKSTAASYAEQGADVAASSLGDFADAVRKAADKLNERDQGLAARLVAQAADGLEQVASSISGSSVDDMMGSVQRFARQNPAAFVGVAVLAGVALGRFARASSERSNASSEDWSSTSGYRGPTQDYRGPARHYGGEGLDAGGYTGGGASGSSGGGSYSSGNTLSGATSISGQDRGSQPNRPQGDTSGTASAGRPMAAGTGPAAGRSTAAPASSQPKK